MAICEVDINKATEDDAAMLLQISRTNISVTVAACIANERQNIAKPHEAYGAIMHAVDNLATPIVAPLVVCDPDTLRTTPGKSNRPVSSGLIFYLENLFDTIDAYLKDSQRDALLAQLDILGHTDYVVAAYLGYGLKHLVSVARGGWPIDEQELLFQTLGDLLSLVTIHTFSFENQEEVDAYKRELFNEYQAVIAQVITTSQDEGIAKREQEYDALVGTTFHALLYMIEHADSFDVIGEISGKVVQFENLIRRGPRRLVAVYQDRFTKDIIAMLACLPQRLESIYFSELKQGNLYAPLRYINTCCHDLDACYGQLDAQYLTRRSRLQRKESIFPVYLSILDHITQEEIIQGIHACIDKTLRASLPLTNGECRQIKDFLRFVSEEVPSPSQELENEIAQMRVLIKIAHGKQLKRNARSGVEENQERFLGTGKMGRFGFATT